jgi:hypothetical protein
MRPGFGIRVIFGAITLACLVAALVFSMLGQYPALMVPTAIACEIVFIRNGDGREHAPVSATSEREPPTGAA